MESKGSAVSAATYHPRDLVESFADMGIVCALYEPKEGFANDPASKLFKLCDRADIVILDWDLYKADGENILPLVHNLADSAQSSVPHHVRLCVIYTTKPDLKRVAGQIYDALAKDKALDVEAVDQYTILAGATRVVILGKPDVTGRGADDKPREVKESELASRVIREFAEMNSGLLPSYALSAMAAVRRNTKRIIDKFDKALDAPFLVNRALVLDQEEAFDQLPELLSEEILSIIQDRAVSQEALNLLATEFANSVALDSTKIVWPLKEGRPAKSGESLVRQFLAGGKIAIKEDVSYKTKNTDNLHLVLGCVASNGHKKLAALFDVRTNYGDADPLLQLGTLVRRKENDVWMYAVCMQPLCDSVRLPRTVGDKSKFPFWTLTDVAVRKKGLGIVVAVPGGTYAELVLEGKPREKMWLSEFQAGEAGVVNATKVGTAHVFGNSKLEWVGQLKPSHAQRVAYEVGQKLSRVGLIEAEWLRQRSEEG